MSTAGLDAAVLPFPPKVVRRAQYRVEPMTRDCALAWIASYNAFVRLWNRMEADRKSPLPDADLWTAAEGLWWWSMPRSCLTFIPREEWAGEGVTIAIRIRGFHKFHPGWSFLKNEADPAAIMWGGWFLDGGRRHRRGQDNRIWAELWPADMAAAAVE